MNLETELQKLVETLETKPTIYNAVLEVDYTPEELAKVEKLRKHFDKNPEKDVRNHIEAVRVLFPSPTYVVGSGGSHIWVCRSENKYERIVYIGSAKNCQLWEPKQSPKIIFP